MENSDTQRHPGAKTERVYVSLQIHLSDFINSKHQFMTEYSTAIFGLIAFTAVVSAAVVYVLAQPSDLPVVKKAKATKS